MDNLRRFPAPWTMLAAARGESHGPPCAYRSANGSGKPIRIRHRSGRAFGIRRRDRCMIDLDRFKPVNDTYGHDVGDELLKSVATRIDAELHGGHLVARLGGDEFGVLFDAELNIADATRAAERIVRTLETPFAIAADSIGIGASIGLAAAVNGDDARTLKRRADDRLYSVKRSGRGHVLSDTPAAVAA